MTAQGEPSFASRCSCRDKEEEIGEDFATVIHAIDIRDAGRKDCQRAEDEDVGIDIRNRVGDDALHDGGEVFFDCLGEGWKGYGLCGRAVRKPGVFLIPHFLIRIS